MNQESAKFYAAALLFVCLAMSGAMSAQVPGSVLSGTVKDGSGNVIPNAKLTVRNAATGKAVDAQTGAAGTYNIENLAPGEYEVSTSAEGFTPRLDKVTLAADTTETLNVSLNPGNLSLEGLGFPSAATKGNPQEQIRLDKRTHMLKMHQRLGLITTVPMAATVILGAGAGGRSTSSTERDIHAALGSVTTGLYFTTAYYAIFAPKIPETRTRGQIRLHKALAFIHGPGMVLTPILGAMAFQQKSRGERIHGLASAHGPVAIITAGAFGAAILSVSLKF